MDLDPENNMTHRVWAFYDAYRSEGVFLTEWHRDGKQLAAEGVTAGNQLRVKFGETWGEPETEIHEHTNMEANSYFQVLASVSDMLQNKAKEYLKKKDGTDIVDDDSIKAIDENGVVINDEKTANQRSQECIDWLLETLTGDKSGAAVVDEAAAEVAAGAGSRNLYLKALHQMMIIERNCFEFQVNFLRTGRP